MSIQSIDLTFDEENNVWRIRPEPFALLAIDSEEDLNFIRDAVDFWRLRDDSRVQYIRENLSHEDLLGQLAEEASELCHAALKLERVVRGTNPTPVTQTEAMAKLCEEVADVLNALEVLKIWPGTESIKVIRDEKMDRWVQRIEESRRNSR